MVFGGFDVNILHQKPPKNIKNHQKIRNLRIQGINSSKNIIPQILQFLIKKISNIRDKRQLRPFGCELKVPDKKRRQHGQHGQQTYVLMFLCLI